jgi:hypothetical protein
MRARSFRRNGTPAKGIPICPLAEAFVMVPNVRELRVEGNHHFRIVLTVTLRRHDLAEQRQYERASVVELSVA